MHEHNNTYILRRFTPKCARVYLVLEGKKTEIIVKNSLLDSPKGRGVGCSAFLSVVPLFFLLGLSWKLQCVYREVLYPMVCQKSQSGFAPQLDKMEQHGRTSYGT